MVFDDHKAAADVLGRELTLTRKFFDMIGAVLSPILRAATKGTRFGAANDTAAKHVMTDLDYPNDGAIRS